MLEFAFPCFVPRSALRLYPTSPSRHLHSQKNRCLRHRLLLKFSLCLPSFTPRDTSTARSRYFHPLGGTAVLLPVVPSACGLIPSGFVQHVASTSWGYLLNGRGSASTSTVKLKPSTLSSRHYVVRYVSHFDNFLFDALRAVALAATQYSSMALGYSCGIILLYCRGGKRSVESI